MLYCVGGGVSPLARASAAETSSAVRFLDSRKATRLSTGEAATVGSCRTEKGQHEHEEVVICWEFSHVTYEAH